MLIKVTIGGAMTRFVVACLMMVSVSHHGVAAGESERFVCTTLVASGNPQYPPLLWRSDRSPGELVGAIPAFLRELTEPLGVKVEVRDKGSWARVQHPDQQQFWSAFRSVRKSKPEDRGGAHDRAVIPHGEGGPS